MRILVAHNHYQQHGGEDAVFANETALLEEAGHEVHRYEVHNDAIAGASDKVRAFLTVPYSRAARKLFEAQLDAADPDVVHVHNYFPLITPAVFYACTARGVPVVHTLHNFRMTCANGLLLRDGRVCEKCVSGSPFWAAAHRCYRNSFAGSLAVARMISAQRRWGTWDRQVSLFIALTQFERDKLIEAGFPPEKIRIKPNFIPDPGTSGRRDRSKPSGALYVGRLSREKGLHTLIEAWRELQVPLRVAGDGPLLDELRKSAPDNVEFLGRLPSEQVHVEMTRAALLVMPSNWYEGFPVTLVEALACGLPIAASRIGSLQQLVRDGENGFTFEPGNSHDIVKTVRAAFEDRQALAKLSRGARAMYEGKYTSQKNLEQLVAIYTEACASQSAASMERPGSQRADREWMRRIVHTGGNFGN